MAYVWTDLTPPQMDNQRGQCCGLYALTSVARVLNVAYADLRATKGDNAAIRFPPSLRWMAKKADITKIGEIFYSSEMERLAEIIGLRANVINLKGTANWFPAIQNSINNRRYLLAPFGVNPANGQPIATGRNAHWCVIWGYASDPNDRTLPAKARAEHWNITYEFSIPALRISSIALRRFSGSYWHKTGGHMTNYQQETRLIFRRGRHIPSASLPDTLAGRLVEVWY